MDTFFHNYDFRLYGFCRTILKLGRKDNCGELSFQMKNLKNKVAGFASKGEQVYRLQFAPLPVLLSYAPPSHINKFLNPINQN
jgi:hypothetical protein